MFTILEHGKIYKLENEHGDILIASPCEIYQENYFLEPIEEYHGDEHCEYGGTIKFADLNEEIQSGGYKIVEG